MTAIQFYENYIKQIAVDEKTINDAQKRRNEIATKAKAVVAAKLGAEVKYFPAGALAAGTQIAPLNDVDTVLEAATRPSSWETDPQQALRDVRDWVKPVIAARYSLSAHAIKLEFADEDFTADIVIGVTRPGGGLFIPHCPDDEPHGWIETHPVAHAAQVRERNKAIGYEFAREIRIVKALNRKFGMADEDGKKPLSSFHVTALALTYLTESFNHADGTALLLKKTAESMFRPLPDPAGVGPDLEARDPAKAHQLFAEAAEIAAKALTVNGDEAERLLTGLFGDQEQVRKLVGGGPVSVTRSGLLVAGLGASSTRSVQPVRSYGDR